MGDLETWGEPTGAWGVTYWPQRGKIPLATFLPRVRGPRYRRGYVVTPPSRVGYPATDPGFARAADSRGAG